MPPGEFSATLGERPPKVLKGPVAQRLEQGTHNPLVGGSNPSGPTSNRGAISAGVNGNKDVEGLVRPRPAQGAEFQVMFDWLTSKADTTHCPIALVAC
jgi:hypothetical protein